MRFSLHRRGTSSFLASHEKPDGDDIDVRPSIFSIFQAASQFQRVLAARPRGDSEKSSNDATSDELNGFEKLVRQDLDESEEAIAKQVDAMSVASDRWLDPSEDLVEEPEEISSDSSGEDIEGASYLPHRETKYDAEPWKVEPSEVIRLLTEEFGPLVEEDEEEKLLYEADGILLYDVLILGVIHLTTHRLTFHASLLDPGQDVNDVVKSGPVTIHFRKKLRRGSRRVWMELSRDMVCMYPSSKFEDKLRPLRAVLLSSVRRVHSRDPKHPRRLRAQIEYVNSAPAPFSESYLEFDTEESADDWRKELNGCLFMYRHRRHKTLENTTVPNTVRISIPLDRCEKVEKGAIAQAPNILSFHLRVAGSDNVFTDLGESKTQVIQIGPPVASEPWLNIERYMSKAKEQHLSPEHPIFVDLGPITFSDSLSHGGTQDEEETREVRIALGMTDESNVFVTKWVRMRGGICSGGYLALSPRRLGFFAKYIAKADLKFIVHIRSIKDVRPQESKFVRGSGIVVEIEGHKDVRFDFKDAKLRDEVLRRILTAIIDYRLASAPSTPTSSIPRSATDVLAPIERSRAAAAASGMTIDKARRLPKTINMPREQLFNRSSLHFVCLTIGSRGDVQPYIALGLGLQKEGHSVTIVTHAEYKSWIESFGLCHREAGGDPAALMKLSVSNKMFSPEFFHESLTNFRPWLDQLLIESWEGCKDADVLLESPQAFAGYHIAEALGIPYFRTSTMPWSKTTEFPHAFLSPPVDAAKFNSATYILFNNVMWAATSGQINRWRKNTLNLKSTTVGHLAQSEMIYIYNFSRFVVPKPLDWGDTTTISGYWFLDTPSNWEPPASLTSWMEKSRAEDKPIVYIGFGSITVPSPNRVTSQIIKAVVKADVRAIISKGWSSRMSKDDGSKEMKMPEQCYQLDSVPHDWLFPQMDAIFHHGGAGTTGASLRAGKPTIIKPWFGDQFFWANRIQKLGAGIKVSLDVDRMASALTRATSDRIMKERAASIGAQVRAEDGVHTTIYTIYTYLKRAGSGHNHKAEGRE